MTRDRVAAIEELIRASLTPESLEIEDQSHLHAGHAGAKDGKGHFHVTLVAAGFAGKSPIQRHRMVYDAVADMLKTDIHALSIDALAPGE
jgi:BolA protein